jgi:pheromone shutdown protein TraB
MHGMARIPKLLLQSNGLLIACLHLQVVVQVHARSPWSIGIPSLPSSHFPGWGQVRRGGTSYVSESPTTLPHHIEDNNNATANNTNQTSPQLLVQVHDQIPEWKKQLPPPLCHKSNKTLVRIRVPYQNQVAEIYLLGTAHVSNDSSRDVKLLLDYLQPNVIFVELCDQRTALMEDPPQVLQNLSSSSRSNNKQNKIPFFQKVHELQKSNNNSKLQCMATVLLTSTQEDYADSLGVELGGEFRVAYQYWRSFATTAATKNNSNNNNQNIKQQQRPHLILGDRPLAITLARCWESLSFFGKIKVLIGLLLSSFHKPSPEELRAWIQKIMEDETDLLSSSLEELRKHFPTLERVIIQERDAYMACKLYQLCRGMLVSAVREQQQAPEQAFSSKNRIVIAALVGAGHVPGISAWLTTKNHPEGPEAILDKLIATKKYANADLSALVYEVTELQDVPPPSSSSTPES